MEGLSLENLGENLNRKGDYTIRLMTADKQYLFALLRLDGSHDTWTARLVDQNRRMAWQQEQVTTSFQEAKQVLIDKIEQLCSAGYRITKVQSGYDIPPWLRRRRLGTSDTTG